MATPCNFGFRIFGGCHEARRLIDWAAAFRGYCECDQRAETDREGYLSAFTFGADFRRHLELTDSTKGYNGVCASPWLWWDIDREGDLQAATNDARRLAAAMVERYRLDDDGLLLFFSGSKGFHVGLPTALWLPAPSATFNRTARRFAEALAEQVGVAIDTSIYDKVRAFRAPNSRHPKTGLHKRRLTLDELLHLKAEAIVKLAVEPLPFDLPEPPELNPQAVADWQAAAGHVEQQAEATKQRRLVANGSPTLNRSTQEFIRDGANAGDRHRLLFSAAANLAEFGCPLELAWALLSETALDSGLPPSEVRRQIECGLQHKGT
jgi:hypothetical protein